MAAESEAILEDGSHFGSARHLWHVVQVTVRVRAFEVGRRVNLPSLQRLQASEHFQRPRAAQGMADHRLGRANWNRVGQLAECGLDRERLGEVVEGRRGSVSVDIVDLVRSHRGVSEGQ